MLMLVLKSTKYFRTSACTYMIDQFIIKMLALMLKHSCGCPIPDFYIVSYAHTGSKSRTTYNHHRYMTIVLKWLKSIYMFRYGCALPFLIIDRLILYLTICE